jgi:hypothetical protein
MALTYTVFEDQLLGVSDTITSTSRSFNAGELVVIAWCTADNFAASTPTNSGTAQTWVEISQVGAAGSCRVAAWYCVISTTQSMTISVQATESGPMGKALYTIQHAGQHATTPVPAGNRFSGTISSDASQSITPTASGSCLWMFAGDWNATDTFAAAADCTLNNKIQQGGQQTTTLIRPTTQPRADTSAFTIGETDTGGPIAWAAWEVQAAAGGSPTLLPPLTMAPMLPMGWHR